MRRKNSYDRPGVSPFASQYATAKESEAKLPVLMPRTKNANDNTPDEDIRSDCATLYKSELADEDAILKRRGALRSRRGSPGSAAGAVTVSGRGPSKANLPVLPRRSSNQNFRPFYKPTLFVIFAERVMYFFANVFIVGTVIYTITHFVLAIRHDLAAMSNKYSTELKTKISECTHQYMQNKCHPDTRVRYMDEQCISWEICMNQKPSEVLHLKAAAEVASKTINTFFEDLTYRSAVLGLAFFMATLFVAIRGITLYRLSVIREEKSIEEHRSAFSSREMSAVIAAASSAIAARQDYHLKSNKDS